MALPFVHSYVLSAHAATMRRRRYGRRFDNCNTEGLMAEMSAQEKAGFHFDVRSIDWTDYITNVHIPGLRKHVMKGRGIATASSSPSASPSTMEELAAASASAV
ncbi:Fatty acyl-CoA reductase 2 [Hordeum vulgare]|nr:Fatty acyl-CoA reductase 2 [Hordeum vulgare]